MNDLHFAVIVGINLYVGLPTLSSPVSDARDFENWLIDRDGGNVPPINIEPVDASSEAPLTADTAKPIKANIDSALEKINRRVRDVDPDEWARTRLYVFVAGHGITPHDGDGALLTADASLDKLGCNLELSMYRRWYRNCALFRETIFFADCCREYQLMAPAGGPVFTNTTTTGRSVAFVNGYGSEAGGMAYGDGNAAVQDPNLRRGYFTRALLDGLRGGARDVTTGRVTATSLDAFVKERVAEAAKAAKQEQIASFERNQDVEFGPTTPGAPVRYPVTIVAPESGGPYKLLDGSLSVIGEWRSGADAWQIQVPAGLYRVVRKATLDGSGLIDDGYFSFSGGQSVVRL